MTRRATHQVRVGRQPQDRPGPRPDDPAVVVRKWLRTVGVCYAGPVTGPDVHKSLRRGLHRPRPGSGPRDVIRATEVLRGGTPKKASIRAFRSVRSGVKLAVMVRWPSTERLRGSAGREVDLAAGIPTVQLEPGG
jgi:hypothetical protein